MNANAQAIVENVHTVAAKVAKRATQRFSEAAAPGDGQRQGDVYITLLGMVPSGVVKQAKWNKQLAPGTSQGSRHIIDSKVGVTCYLLKDAGEYDGPVLVLKNERTITHPEHGNWILPPGIYGISYQRTMDSEDRIRRVQD
jgi:hypothetical protein